MRFQTAIVIMAAALGSGWNLSGAEPRFDAARGVICLQPVRNDSKAPLSLDGVSEAQAEQFRSVGLTAGPLREMAACDAHVYTEIVEVTGRNRRTVVLEFRFVINDMVVVLSTTAKGRSKVARQATLPREAFGFVERQTNRSARVAAEREALLEAFADQARRIVHPRAVDFFVM